MRPAAGVFSLLIVVGMTFSSCTTRQPDITDRIDSLRTQAEELIKAQSLMGWNSWAFGAQANQDSLYQEYAHLFTLENIRLVRSAEAEEVDSVQRNRLKYFRRWLTFEYISKTIAPLTDRASNLEANATITFDGSTIPYHEVGKLLSNEMKQKRRASLYALLNPVLDSLNPILVEAEQTSRRIAKDLGYASYDAAVEELKGFSLQQMQATAKRILAETDSVYKTLLAEMLEKKLKIRPDRFYRYDTGPLFRSPEFDKYFTAQDMMKVVATTYRGLGVDIDAQTNLRIDATPRENKNPRAVCYPLDIPNDIRLSIKPIGGFDDYSALFHEMGHGLHYANTRENALEFKYLGEATVTEGFAFLSEYLLANQAWLRVHSTMPRPVLKDFIRFQAFYRLWYVRRYCSKFLYEMELRSGAPNPGFTYAKMQGDAIGFTPTAADEKRYLTDIDALYYSASYLRAWFLEAQLSAKLSREFGSNWFEHPGAGEFLRALWAQGDRLDGDEFVRMIGYEKITPDVLLEQIRMMILFSTQ